MAASRSVSPFRSNSSSKTGGKKGPKPAGKPFYAPRKAQGEEALPAVGSPRRRPDRNRTERTERPATERSYRPDRPARASVGRGDQKKTSSFQSRRDKPAYAKPDYPKKTQGKTGYAKPDRLHKREHAVERPAPAPLRDGAVLLWGQHAVREAWLNPRRRCFRLRATAAANEAFAATLTQAQDALLKRPDPGTVERAELDRITPPGSVHQGIVLEAAPLVEPMLRDIIAVDQPPDLILMLDQVTDPHNVGAILRSAAAFGAGAVIMTERNAPGSTGVLAKSASGALEHVPMIHVVNLARALDELKQAGYWSVGLAEQATQNLAALDLTGRTVIVLGAEGEGLRHLTRQKCDELARLPTGVLSGGPIGSLNVSNAAAIGLYEVRRQKNSAG